MPTTVLVLNYKHGSVDKRKSVVKSIEKIGIVFESKLGYENQIPPLNRFFNINPSGLKMSPMLTDFVGNDLSKLVQKLQNWKFRFPKTKNVSLNWWKKMSG